MSTVHLRQLSSDSLFRLGEYKRIGQIKEFSLLLFYPGQASKSLLALIQDEAYQAFRDQGFELAPEVDWYNSIYSHLILWNDKDQDLVGWYRFAKTAETLRDHGLKGLYSSTLFQFEDEFMDKLAHGLELGRNFITKKYQKTFALAYLWSGFAHYLEEEAEIKYIFGLMSVPGSVDALIKSYIAYFYTLYFGSRINQMVRAHQPFIYSESHIPEIKDRIKGEDFHQEFKRMSQQLKASGFALPNVIKHGSSLCEAKGTHLLAIGLDPDFGGCVDMFMLDEVDRIKSHKLKKYRSLIRAC